VIEGAVTGLEKEGSKKEPGSIGEKTEVRRVEVEAMKKEGREVGGLVVFLPSLGQDSKRSMTLPVGVADF
jgi:hypothetical protein